MAIKISRGGRRTATTQAQGGTNVGGGFGSIQGTINLAQQQQAQPAPTLNQKQNTNLNNYTPPQVVDGQYVNIDDNYNDYLYNQHKMEYKRGLSDAMKQYISQADAGQGYSMAQWLNYKLNHNIQLNANERNMYKQITGKAYDLGQNAILFRADHDNVLKDNFGIADYSKLSISQLQAKLVGQTYTNKGVISTSYDKDTNPFYHLAKKSNSGVSGGREIYYNYYTKSGTKVVQGDRRQTEVCITPNQSFKILGVKYDNSYATPRNGASRQRLIIDVEVG